MLVLFVIWQLVLSLVCYHIDLSPCMQFKECGAAERAKDNMDGFELAGRPIKVKDVTEGSQMNSNAMEMLDSENYAVGVGMTQQGRAQLMAKLAVGHHTGAARERSQPWAGQWVEK